MFEKKQQHDIKYRIHMFFNTYAHRWLKLLAGWQANRRSVVRFQRPFLSNTLLYLSMFLTRIIEYSICLCIKHTHTQSTRLAAWSKSTFKSSIMKRVYISPKWKKTTHTHKTTTCSNNNTKIDHWNAWLWSIEPIWNHRKWFVYFTTWIDLCV